MGFEKTLEKEKKFSYDGTLDVQDFINFLKKALKKRGYEHKEKVYTTAKDPSGKKTIFIIWEVTKNLDEYHKSKMEWKCAFLNLKEKAKLSEGSFNYEAKLVLEFDKEDEWTKSSYKAFLRHFYDKFAKKKENDKLEQEVKDDLEYFIEQMKKYTASK